MFQDWDFKKKWFTCLLCGSTRRPRTYNVRWLISSLKVTRKWPIIVKCLQGLNMSAFSAVTVNCFASTSMKNGTLSFWKMTKPKPKLLLSAFLLEHFKFYFSNKINGFSLFTCPLIVLKHFISNERGINIWFFFTMIVTLPTTTCKSYGLVMAAWT